MQRIILSYLCIILMEINKSMCDIHNVGEYQSGQTGLAVNQVALVPSVGSNPPFPIIFLSSPAYTWIFVLKGI